jgi:hypothetical protein
MVRLSSIALIAFSIPAAAWSAPPSSADDSKLTFHLPQSAEHQHFAPAGDIGRTKIGDAYFGFGVFGLKADKTNLRPVTVGETNAPKQRRAALGFSLEF